MILDIVFVVAGLVLLFLGGEALVRGSVAIAEKLGLSKLLIGLIIVGFGTSAPELLVSVNAALGGASDISIGNVVGSNIANILLIVGVTAAIVPISGWGRSAKREAFVALIVSFALYGLVFGAAIGRVEGAVMVSVLIAYLGTVYWLERKEAASELYEHETEEFEGLPAKQAWLAPVLSIAGIGLLVVGADLLVDGAVSIARAFGVSDAVIGLSLVAIGTSLPELATAIVAAVRKHLDVVLGNVIGSNIFNILSILGITTIIQPIDISARFRAFDVPIMLATAAVLLLLLFVAKSIGRATGVIMLVAYAAYMGLLFSIGVTP